MISIRSSEGRECGRVGTFYVELFALVRKEFGSNGSDFGKRGDERSIVDDYSDEGQKKDGKHFCEHCANGYREKLFGSFNERN